RVLANGVAEGHHGAPQALGVETLPLG
ncbi:MAG: hypothetical protein RIU67_903, partial [Actinomycetota bacterium]